MGTALIWAIVTLVIAGTLIACSYRLTKRIIDAKVTSMKATQNNLDLELEERRLTLEIACDTRAETIELEKARLQKHAAEARAETEMIDTLADAREEAERAVIAARSAARVEMANEVVRSELRNSVDPVSQWQSYLEAFEVHPDTTEHLEPMDFEEFINALP